MAVDKLVDSTHLDANLTSVANAIRAKGGTSGSLAFPAGFVDAIDAIETGGGFTTDEIMSRTASGALVYSLSDTPKQWWDGFAYITSFSAPNLTAAWNQNFCFRNCTRLAHVSFPKVSNIYGIDCFRGTAIQTLVLPCGGNKSSTSVQVGSNFVGDCNALTAFDSYSVKRINSKAFSNATSLSTIIIRHLAPNGNSLPQLDNVDAFTGTPFANGGAGGTIYIPKVLYDELGTASALDFKAATNWSTIDGYGTITWAKIEGSQYENYYADGTPIS